MTSIDQRAPRADGRVGSEGGSTNVLLALLIGVLLTQRLAVSIKPGQQISLSIIVVLLIVAYGLLSGSLTADRTRTATYCAAVGVLWAVTLVSLARLQDPSLMSIGLIVVIYVFVTIRPTHVTQVGLDRVYRVFVDFMLVSAAISVGQIVLQLAGFAYTDVLGDVVPQSLLLGFYNTADPISYGSDLYRSNGIVFVEPSFLSFFLGVAVILSLHLRRSPVVTTLLFAGIVPTLAGNGLFVIAFGVLTMAFSPRHRPALLKLVVPALIVVVFALATPLGSLFVSRSTEVDSKDSSSSLRLVEPYQQLIPPVLGSTDDLLFGRGAGAASSYIESTDQPSLLAPVIPKLLYEYGLLGATAFLLFTAYWIFSASVGRPWILGVLLAYLVLNAALLQPTLAFVTILFVVTFQATPKAADTAAAHRRLS